MLLINNITHAIYSFTIIIFSLLLLEKEYVLRLFIGYVLFYLQN